MPANENVQSYSAGKSGYSGHAIQPWDIWKEYNLNPWDADIVKCVLRSREGKPRAADYEKIISICRYRIAELSEEVLRETGVTAPAGEEKPVWDGESDDTTVFCPDETMKPAMFYAEGEKWDGTYTGYSVFMTGNAPYMYLGVNAEGYHAYADLSGSGRWVYTREGHLPPKTVMLRHTGLFGNHRSSLRIGYTGTNYGKHDYIITGNGVLLRYFGMRGDRFVYRNMSAKRADGSYPEISDTVKLVNRAIQFTL